MTAPLPLTLPALIPATVRPKQPEPADRMKRLEERYLWPGVFGNEPKKNFLEII